jgi:hypothetical protein
MDWLVGKCHCRRRVIHYAWKAQLNLPLLNAYLC